MASRHSAKPDAVYEMTEKVSPAPCIELYARSPRVGRTTWGNEVHGKGGEHRG